MTVPTRGVIRPWCWDMAPKRPPLTGSLLGRRVRARITYGPTSMADLWKVFELIQAKSMIARLPNKSPLVAGQQQEPCPVYCEHKLGNIDMADTPAEWGGILQKGIPAEGTQTSYIYLPSTPSRGQYPGTTPNVVRIRHRPKKRWQPPS